MSKKYATTISELAVALSLSRETLYKYIKMDDWPSKTKGGKFNVIKVGEYIKKKQTASMKQQQGANVDLKRKKLELENAILQEKLDRLRGVSISVLEYHEELMSYTTIVNQVFDQFYTETKLLNNKKLLVQVERLRDVARSDIRNKLSLLEEKVEKIK